MSFILLAVSIGIFDDILIPVDAMQHPSRLYPLPRVLIKLLHVKLSLAAL